MYRTRNDLPAQTRATMIAILNARLADAVDLRTQAKVAHWNVKGRQFAALHELFDGVAHAVDEYADLIAERAVQLGGIARGTARQVAAATDLEEYSAVGGTAEHVAALADALAAFGWAVRKMIDESSSAGDHATADIFTEVSRGIGKFLWMVEAHLQTGDAVSAARSERDAQQVQ